MTNTTEIAVIDPSPAESELAAQQLIAIEPTRYVSLVFAPVTEKLARYKTEADAISMPDVTTAAGMKTAIEWRAKFRDEIRLATESARKERKAPILEIGRLLDGRAKEIAQESAPYEARFDEAIKAHEAALATAKQAREEAERVSESKIAKMETLAEIYTSAMPSGRIADIIRQLEAGLTHDYGRHAERAESARQAALVVLRPAHIEALEREAREEAERAAAAAEEARLRAVREAEESRKAAERAEQERVAAEARVAEEARLAEVRRRLDAERAEQERQAAERRAADEQRAREDRERLEAERKEQERVAILRERLADLRSQATIPSDWTSAQISDRINFVNHIHTDDGSWLEFAKEAQEIQITGIRTLAKLFDAATAREAESSRLATERAELERQQAEQAERQADIERREREQRETEERQRREAAEAEARRIAAEQAERERQEAEAARQREAEERRARLKARVSQLQAWEIADIVAQELGTDSATVAERIAEIAHDEWVALSMSVVGEEEAA